MVRKKSGPRQNVPVSQYPTDADYTPRFLQIVGMERRSYRIPGLPFEAALIMGSVSKDDLIEVNPKVVEALKHYDPKRHRYEVGFIAQVQHYVFWALRESDAALRTGVYDGNTLTPLGVKYMEAMEFNPDLLPNLTNEGRAKLKDDLAIAVDEAFKIMKAKEKSVSD